MFSSVFFYPWHAIRRICSRSTTKTKQVKIPIFACFVYPSIGVEDQQLTGIFYLFEGLSKNPQSAALLGVGHLAVAWNEEQIFRGYGFDTLRQAVGGWGAVAILAPLFALEHVVPTKALQFLSFTITGGVLTVMRVESGSIWP